MCKFWQQEALLLIHQLLDAEPDALDPRADLDRLIPRRCPDCGSSNVSDADEEGFMDCFDCGIWFDPLHPDNSPSVPGNYPLQDGLEDEIPDLKNYTLRHGAKPFGYVLKSKSKPAYAGKEYPTRYPWLNARASDFREHIGDATVFKRLRTAQQWPELEVIPVYSDPRKTGLKALDPLSWEPPEPKIICPRCGNKFIRKDQRNYKVLPDQCPYCLHRHFTMIESLDDEIPDLKRYAMQHGRPPRIRISFARVTPESAEQGDFSETGWIDEEGVDMSLDEWDREDGLTVADKAIKFLRKEGAFEASSSAYYPGVWYSSAGDTDYRTGESEERNYHLTDFTPEEEREVWEKFHQQR